MSFSGGCSNRQRDSKAKATAKGLEEQQPSQTAQSTSRPIRPLPDHVVAQIKSSTTITSLTGVVEGLLQNSLDASASKIEITVDFRRGGCMIEDNGLGVPPAEFGVDGGLAKMYHTSKYVSHTDVHGSNGMFLASLGAMSLLTISSRHHLHRAQNTLVVHHSQVMARHVPSPPSHAILFREHGTQVIVRNLFGNMPVRVKRRAAAEDRTEQDRLWDGLKKSVVAHMLGWQKPVTVRMQDWSSTKTLNLVESTLKSDVAPFQEGDPKNGERISPALRRVLNPLTQAGFILPNQWGFWVPISATTPSVRIKGAISLEPAPAKNVQFICLGVRPITVESGYNELYDAVNRVFSSSNFGLFDDSDVEEAERERRKHDRRFKQDGFTNRRLRGSRKGVDKWPMFFIHIRLATDQGRAAPGLDDVLSSNSMIRNLIEILSAMVTEWLGANHFCPRKLRRRRNERHSGTTSESAPSTPGSDTNRLSIRGEESRADVKPNPSLPHIENGEIESPSLQPLSAKAFQRRKSPAEDSGRHNAKRIIVEGQQPFNGWSRIKSSKSSFFDDMCIRGAKRRKITPVTVTSERETTLPNTERITTGQNRRSGGISADHAVANPPTGLQCRPHNVDEENGAGSPATVEENEADADMPEDGTITWRNPDTNETLWINRRTGVVVHRPQSRPKSDGLRHRIGGTPGDAKRSIRLSSRQGLNQSDTLPTRWLDEFLKKWDNPIFQPTDKAIPRVRLDTFEPQSTGRGKYSNFFSRGNTEEDFLDATALGHKISKEALRSATILAQVDEKYILIKIRPSKRAHLSQAVAESELLVLIDQHAADERCRLEDLLAELCCPPTVEKASFRSKLGYCSGVNYMTLSNPLSIEVSAREGELCKAQAVRFASWGILYDVEASKSTDEGKETLVVMTLPPGISERCKTNPSLLISLIRSEIWALTENSERTTLSQVTTECSTSTQDPGAGPASTPTGTSIDAVGPNSWLGKISSCPKGILDMLNSRSCRSAIMFNDVLSFNQCETLVRRLATCAFPFQCAHGRPSMVPLVDLGSFNDIELGTIGSGFFGQGTRGASNVGFVDAFRKWRDAGDL
ncbi:hypothetical protein BDY21DRAFT_332455 [Lineolata rhizophorae]|uniref:MutL C-terminal dimerisation domain-containing protein n=1 Tax=Lineolata rhizophorae TaxID=578093 RepID=A0A6A6PC73_9PEZI|nr:hypothetical protein BDY21DRAFT_332455 [Lineolata rhizophorae]